MPLEKPEPQFVIRDGTSSMQLVRLVIDGVEVWVPTDEKASELEKRLKAMVSEPLRTASASRRR